MKSEIKIPNYLKKYSTEAGLTIMALATIIGLVDIPDHTVKVAYITPQPIKYGNVNGVNQETNPMRREKEENSTEYLSYSEAERTPSRSKRF